MRHFSESVYPADVQDAHLLTSKLRLSQLLQFWARDLHQKPCLRHTMVLLDLRVVHSQVDTSTLQAKTQASITPPHDQSQQLLHCPSHWYQLRAH